jgi:nucleoid DNA-binding protein
MYSCPEEKKIIDKVAKDLGMTKEQVLQVVDFQRKTIRETIEKGTFEPVRLAYLGKFAVSEKRLKAINNKNYYELIRGKRRETVNSTGDTED